MIKLKTMNSSLYEIAAYSSSSIASLQAQIEEVTLMIGRKQVCQSARKDFCTRG